MGYYSISKGIPNVFDKWLEMFKWGTIHPNQFPGVQYSKKKKKRKKLKFTWCEFTKSEKTEMGLLCATR